MPRMAKKKTSKKGDSQPPIKDKHRPHHMVRLSPELFQAMKRLADEGNRPLSRELRQAVMAWLQSKGRLPDTST